VGTSGGWGNITLPLAAAQGAFGRRCGKEGGADVVLTSTSAADTILSTLEVFKV